MHPAAASLPPPPWRDRLLAHWRRRGWRGYLTLTRWLKPAGGRRELTVATRYGSQFLLEPGDSVDGHVLHEGFYESEVLEAILPALDEHAVLWVVGANFGLHAVTAKFLRPAARVIAFEPAPAMAARIIEHGRLNHARPDLVTLALSDRTGVLPFHVNENHNPGASTLLPIPSERYAYTVLVAVERADTLIDAGRAPAPTAMIVDVERAELEVFLGLGRHLANPQLTHLVFEADNALLESPTPARLVEILRAAGFSLRRLERREHTAHDCSNFLATRPASRA